MRAGRYENTMTLFANSRLSRSRFGSARHQGGAPAAARSGQPAATLTRDELLREVIAVLG